MKKFFQLTSIVLVLMLSFSINSYSGPRNVLLEYCTGTWCGWCPCGHQALQTIESVYPRTIGIAYHGASSDPWQNFNGNQVRSMLGLNAYPTAIIDRTHTNSPYVTYTQWYGKVESRYQSAPNSNVDIVVTSKSFDMATRELDLSISSTALDNLSGQYKISVAIIENNLIYQQNHYAQCGTTGYVPDYVHNHVARTMINGATGENLNTNPMWNNSEIIVKNINTTLNTEWVPENCEIIVFVYKEDATFALSNVEQAIKVHLMGPTGISGNYNVVPEAYSLSQNYPNPFNPSTNIKFSIPKDGNVSFKVYDLFGKEVENYVDGILKSGTYSVQFDGSGLSSGVYFYVLKTDNFTDKKKMILVK